MTTTYVLSGNLSEQLGVPVTSRNVILTWGTNLGTQALVDLDNDVVYPPRPVRIHVDDNGDITVELIGTNSPGINVVDGTLRYILRAQYWDGAGRKRPWDTGYFELTADTDLSDITGAEYVAPDFASAAMAAIQALIDSGSVGPEGPAGPAGPAGPPGATDDASLAALVANDATDSAAAVDDRVSATIDSGTDVIPNGIIEGRALFQYGPSRGVGVTAQRIHYNRLRKRLGSGFFFNGSVAGHQAADTAALMFGTNATTSRQAGGDNEWAPTVGASTFANKAMQAAILELWPFGNDALHDGKPDRNSTTAKARASARNALHAIVALARAEARIESVLNGTYATTNGSPNITGLANPWYKGMLVQGAGIPANTFVGDMINGGLGGFKLSSSRTNQVDINATATAASASLTFTPVYSGVGTAHWATQTSTAFSTGNMVRTITDGATATYVIHLPTPRRVAWVTTAVDDAEYVGTKAAPFGGTGGAGYSVVVDGGAPIVGTTSNEHRFGALDYCFGQKVVSLGAAPLAAGVHTITITSVGANKLLGDEGLLIESLTPLTTLIMKEVELPAAYYALLPTYGASYAKTQIYNAIIDDEVAFWPADESVITMDITDYGYNKALHISAADGAYAHFNDAGERLVTNAILKRLNQLAARIGLVWP